MATERTGKFGTYYGSLYEASSSLTKAQMKQNATYITNYLISEGWTYNAIAGMLGNMQAESSINPGRWQSESVGNTEGGYGLVQWTPATKYLNWCYENLLTDPSTMDNNIARILYEVKIGIQWIATDDYNFSFSEFTKSTESAQYLASAFLKCYERAGVEVEETRRSNAGEWYSFITGLDITPDDSGSTKKNKRKFKFILFNKRRKV